MDLVDLMLENIEKAKDNPDLKLQIIESGVLDSVRPLFSKHLKSTMDKWKKDWIEYTSGEALESKEIVKD